MTIKPVVRHIEVVPLPRMLKSDIRPMERCCGHHLLAHDASGCLITGCQCRKRGSSTSQNAEIRRSEE